MKAKLLFTFLITTIYSQAQVSDFLNGFNAPNRVIIDNNIIYVKETDKISQINLSDSSPTSTLVYGNLTSPNVFTNIIKDDDIIIVAYTDDNTGISTIGSIDISQSSPTLTDQFTGLGFVQGLAIRETQEVVGSTTVFRSILYFTEENLTTNIVSLKKIDITSNTPVIETVLSTGLTNPQDMEFKDDILYIGDKDTNQILSVDVTQTTPTASVFLNGVNCRGLYVFNDFLYFSDSGIIKKVPFSNTSNITTEATDTGSSTDFLRDVVISGTNLYMPQENFGKIVTNEDLTLSLNEFTDQLSKLSFYNDENKIYIDGLTNLNLEIKIYSLTGSQILSKDVNSNNNTADISNLSSGIYVLNVDNKKTFKFVK